MNYYDLHVRAKDPGSVAESAERLGWAGICATSDLKGLKTLSEKVRAFESNIPIFCGALLEPEKPDDVQKQARKALEYADLVFVLGGEEVNRAASECWESDVLCSPEKDAGRDLVKQKNSGVDHVMTKFMAERSIAIEFDFSSLLETYGMKRSQVMGRMRQNVVLARKYNVPMILASGARDRWGLRGPRDLIAVGKVLGMTDEEAKAAVSTWPEKLIRKSGDRKNPDTLLKGLSVVSWGGQEQKKKRMFGWY